MGPHYEKHLIWYGLPKLQPGEIAVELDLNDVIAKEKASYAETPVYKVKTVLAGKFKGATIRVKTEQTTCSRTIAESTTKRMVLVGMLRKTKDAAPILIARYMNYDDPIRVAAVRRLPPEQQRSP